MNLQETESPIVSPRSVFDQIADGIRIEVGVGVPDARKNFNAFCEFVMEDETKQPWVQGDLHRQWDEIIRRHLMVELLAPIEHAKTTQITVARPLFEIGRNVNLRFKIVSSSDEMAKEKLGIVKKYITDHPRYRAVFPHVKPAPKERWDANVIFVRRPIFSKDPTIEARGILSATEGGRCDWLIADDACDFKNTIVEPANIPKVIAAFYGVWLNRLVEGGHGIYIGSPWHNADLTADLKKNKKFRTFSFPIDKDFTSIWEEKWSTARLKDRALTVGSRVFNQKFRLIALSDEDKLFPPRIIEIIKREDLSIADCEKLYGEDLPIFTGMDLGHRSHSTSPRSCIFNLAVTPDELLIVWRVQYGKWKSTDQARQLIAAYKDLRQSLIHVENNNYQDALLDWIKEIPGSPKSMPIKGFTTGKNKADETLGVPGMAAEMERAGWIVPMKGHNATCSCDQCQWLTELENYPLGLVDGVMASWFAREAAKRGGGIVTKSYSAEPEKNTGQPEDDWYNPKRRDSVI